MKKGLLTILATLSVSAFADTDNAYTLGVGDEISIKVYGEQELSFNYYIADEQPLNYPFVGEVTLVGKSTRAVQHAIYQGLVGDYLIKPEVSVVISDFRDFYITGQIKQPGNYDFEPGLTLAKAIAVAGGLTDRASEDDIQIVHADGKQTKNAKMNYELMPGDSINIDRRFF